jgi:hypothetical protein
MYEKAIANYEREFSLIGEPQEALAVLRKAYETGGAKAYWLAHVELLKARSKRTYVSPIFIAFDYAELRDNEKALDWLEKAYVDRSGWLLELNVDPSWDNIRTDQRFKSLVNRVKSASLN